MGKILTKERWQCSESANVSVGLISHLLCDTSTYRLYKMSTFTKKLALKLCVSLCTCMYVS